MYGGGAGNQAIAKGPSTIFLPLLLLSGGFLGGKEERKGAERERERERRTPGIANST